MLGEQAADNLQERRSLPSDKTKKIRDIRKGFVFSFFFLATEPDGNYLSHLSEIEAGGGRKRERTVLAQDETQGQGFTSTDR